MRVVVFGMLSILPRQALFMTAMSFSTSSKFPMNRSSGAQQRRILVDTDAGFDDVVAIQSLVAHHHTIDMVTVVCGCNKASATHDGLQRLFPQLDIVASADRSRPHQSWLAGFRPRFANFVRQHGVSSSKPPATAASQQIDDTAADSMAAKVQSFLASSPDGGVDLICLGPLSNVAEWCLLFPTLISTKVASVWILGGAHPDAPGRGLFNFGQDAGAAAKVLESEALRDKIYLIPGDETASHLVSPEYIEKIVKTAQTECTDANLLANVVKEEQHYSIFYDPLCVFLYLHPATAARFSSVMAVVNPETGQMEKGTERAYRLASQVDFDAYQAWLLQAIRQSEPVCSEKIRL